MQCFCRDEGLPSMAAAPASKDAQVVPTKSEQAQARSAARKAKGSSGAVAAAERAKEKYALRQSKQAGQAAPAVSSATVLDRRV